MITQHTEKTPRTRRTVAQIWTLAYPIIGLNVLHVLTLAVDTAMCGRLPNGEQALTALGFATQVVLLLMVAMMGLTIGTVALVARAYGGGHNDRVNHVLCQSTQLTVGLSLIVALLGNLVAPLLVGALGASETSLELAMLYLGPMLGGSVFSYLTLLYTGVLRGVGNTRIPFVIAQDQAVVEDQIQSVAQQGDDKGNTCVSYLTLLYTGVLRGVGNTRIPFVIALLCNALNLIFNYGLILGNFGLPALGVLGAALGTVLAKAIGATIMVILLRRGIVPGLTLKLTPTPIDTKLARELGRVGAPAALDMVILNATFMVLIGMLGRLDEAAVAAHNMGMRVQALAFVPGLSISQATGALVGHALGANDVQQARRVVRVSVFMTTVIMSLLALAIIGAVEPIVRIFDIDPNTSVGQLTTTCIQVFGYGMPIVGIYVAFVGMFQGSGKTFTGLRINLVATAFCQIPLAGLLGFTLGFGAAGVWASLPLSFIVRCILGVLVYRSGRWATPGTRVSRSSSAPRTKVRCTESR